MIHPNDVERWRAKLDQIEAAVARDNEVHQPWAELDALRPERDAEARALVAQLAETRDFPAFKSAADSWSRRPGPYTAFSGFGQMWLNQVANNLPDDPEAVDVLVRAFQTPSSAEDAQARFAEVESVTRDLASKGQPAVGRIPHVLSVFWSTAEGEPGWPVHWKSAPDRMLDLGWVSSWSSADRYAALLDVSRTYFPEDRHRLERVLWFLTKHRFVGLNPRLPDMCAEAAELMARHEPGRGYPSVDDEARAASLAAQLKGELQLAMVGLLDEVRETTGLDLEKSNLQLRTAFDKSSPYRADAYATWTLPGGMSSPGYRLWATRSGLALGVYGGWGGGSQADYDDIAAVMTGELPEGYQFFQVSQHRSGDRLAPVGLYAGGEVFAGVWWDWAGVPDGLALKDEFLTHVERLMPVIRAVMGREGAVIVDASGASERGPLGGAGAVQGRASLPQRQGPLAGGAA